MRRQLLSALLMVVVFTVLLGGLYPLVVTGISQVAFRHEADGSLVEDASGTVVGSELIGQAFTEPKYFWPRPSAAGDGYDALASAASNLGPNDSTLLSEVEARAQAYRAANGLAPGAEVPVDAVTASGSGLDPHISVDNARLLAPRVAEARGLPIDTVQGLVDDATEDPSLDVLGATAVNVLRLNLLLDGAGAG